MATGSAETIEAQDEECPRTFRAGQQGLIVIHTDLGTGGVAGPTFAVTRWRHATAGTLDGYFLYLRDRKTQRIWSASWHPCRGAGGVGLTSPPPQTTIAGSRMHVVSESEGIGSELQICVLANEPIELRQLTLTNRSEEPREIDLTTYMELVLQSAEAFESHPVFSKLFVETSWDETGEVLYARRRARSPGEVVPHAAHWRVGDPAEFSIAGYETDRKRFLGRGRSLHDPRVLDPGQSLHRTTGGVLDPCFSLQTVMRLAPGESRSIGWGLAAHVDPNALREIVERFRMPRSIDPKELAPFARIPQVVSGRDRTIPPGRPEPRDANGKPVARSVSPGYQQADSRYRPAKHVPESRLAVETWAAGLTQSNGWGGFTADNAEYRFRLLPDENGALELPPRPWTHIVSNPSCGFIATERGAVSTWAFNSRENRLTRLSNDPVSDPPSEVLFLRDEDTGEYWSPLPNGLPDGCPCEVHYGFGFARYRKHGLGLEQEVELFTPREAPLRVLRLRLTNRRSDARRLALWNGHAWILGDGARPSQVPLETSVDTSRHLVTARRAQRGALSSHIAFATVVSSASPSIDVTDAARAFWHPAADSRVPCIVTNPLVSPLPSRSADDEGIAGFQLQLTLEPDQTVDVCFLLGEVPSQEELEALLAQFRTPDAIEEAFVEVRQYWKEFLGRIRIETPTAAFNTLANGWLVYQNVACRLWGRSSYYQGGGAFGFRDQLQDVLGLRFLDPESTRRQLLLHAAHQFPEGDVLHWWHPPESRGMRTRFGDDLLWLPFGTLEYTQATGDHAIWDEEVPFRAGEPLREGEQERYIETATASESGTLFDHCCRALDRSMATGAHGFPRIGCGDWNDGFSRIGVRGKGESVWLAFFLGYQLPDFIALCRQRNEHPRAEAYQRWLDQLRHAIDTQAWDGAWYRRAFLDDGTPIGSRENRECRIDALAQAWAVLAKMGTRERAEQAMQSALDQLVDRDAGIIKLLTPGFDSDELDVGYIRGYIAGIRENGGQYTHGVLWFIRALAELGRVDEATSLLEMITPQSHTATPARLQVYGAEPYVVAADIYGEAPHTGKAGWTWYTGSAAWMYRLIVETVLGFAIQEGRAIRLRPRLPSSWPGFRLTYQVPGSTTLYEIEVRRARSDDEKPTITATCNGVAVPAEGDFVDIPIDCSQSTHRVEILVRGSP